MTSSWSHTAGGLAASGAADRVPERIAQLVYVDATLVLDGGNALTGLSPDDSTAPPAGLVTHRNVVCIAPPAAELFDVTDPTDKQQLGRRLTPHPARAYFDTVHLAHPLGNGLTCTYVTCIQPLSHRLSRSRDLAQTQQGWTLNEFEAGHDAMNTHLNAPLNNMPTAAHGAAVLAGRVAHRSGVGRSAGEDARLHRWRGGADPHSRPSRHQRRCADPLISLTWPSGRPPALPRQRRRTSRQP